MKDCNCDLRDGDAKTAVFGSNEMLHGTYHSADCLSNG